MCMYGIVSNLGQLALQTSNLIDNFCCVQVCSIYCDIPVFKEHLK